MFSNASKWLQDRIQLSTIHNHPYTWCTVDSAMPDDLYSAMCSHRIPDWNLTTLSNLGRVSKTYSSGRLVLPLTPDMPELPNEIRTFWENAALWFRYSCAKILQQSFGVIDKNLVPDILYVRDTTNFNLLPHTDVQAKIITALLYLPVDDSNRGAGTTIYVPKDRNFVCGGGVHHPRTLFDVHQQVDYLPNRLLFFKKCNKSFHGVEPLNVQGERNLIILDLQNKNAQNSNRL